jgi:hypothetical protein
MPKVKAFFEGMKSTQLLWVFAVIVSAGISICLIIFRGAKWLSELISSAANGISIALNAGAAMFAYYKNFYMHRKTQNDIELSKVAVERKIDTTKVALERKIDTTKVALEENIDGVKLKLDTVEKDVENANDSIKEVKKDVKKTNALLEEVLTIVRTLQQGGVDDHVANVAAAAGDDI